MRKISIYALLSILSLGSCTKEFVYNDANDIKENAEQIFGLIDPNQDWRTTTSGTVTVTADADLADIAKVQILTESPFFNGNSVILAEAEATAGQTVTLNYDAPRGAETVIAACTDDKGHYFIKAIDLSTKQVSFATKTAQTRAATRTAEAGIGVSNLTLDGSNVTRSLNANREIYAELGTNSGNSYMTNFTTSKNIAPWANNNWKNEAQWQLTSTSTISGGWNIVEGTVVRDISSSNPMLEDEAKTLKAIFNKYLSHKTNSDGSRVNKNTTHIVQKWSRTCEAALENKAIEESSIGSIFVLKSRFQWRDNTTLTLETGQQTPHESAAEIAQRHSAARLPEAPQLDD